MLSLSPGLAFGSLTTAAIAVTLLLSAEAAAPPATLAARGGDLVTAALIAEGTLQPRELEQDRRRFESWAARLQQLNRGQASQREKVELVFAFMHREILTGKYCKPESELHSALNGGDFNCVAATILFVALCERCELSPQIWSSPGHVMCRLPGRQPLDIETTCPEWFASGPPATISRPDLRQISHRQLIGKVYYNRGILLLENADYSAALAALRTSVRLDPYDRDARENLLAGLCNAAVAHCAVGQYAAAEALLAEARQIEPHYEPLLANDVHVHQRWVVQLCAAGEYAAALELLQQGAARQPLAPLFASGRLTVIELWARARLTAGARDEAQAIVAEGLALDPHHAGLLRTQRQLATGE